MGAFLRENPTATLLPPAAPAPVLPAPTGGNLRLADAPPLPVFTPFSSILISPSGPSRSRYAAGAAAAAGLLRSRYEVGAAGVVGAACVDSASSVLSAAAPSAAAAAAALAEAWLTRGSWRGCSLLPFFKAVRAGGSDNIDDTGRSNRVRSSGAANGVAPSVASAGIALKLKCPVLA